MLKTVLSVLALCAALAGSHQLSSAAVIKAKAWLAPVLVEQAWEKTLLGASTAVKPWPWADTWPVARLQAPNQNVDLMVLAGDSGNTLAFGPGHASASALPGTDGLVVIGGHRDTHFAFLQDLDTGSEIRLQDASGATRTYIVDDAAVVDASRQALAQNSVDSGLLLVTCYPFDALYAGGPLRYVVSAQRLPQLINITPGSPSYSQEYAL
ncbi:MAG: class GN sortase [Halioglobus sp.]